MQLLQTFTQKTQEVRDLYQESENNELKDRRRIVVLSLLGIANAGLMALKQTGVLPKLPDLPQKLFDANYVTTTQKAYEMGLPDATSASALYSLIMMLATFGGKRGIMRPRAVDKILLAAVATNAVAAFQYQYNMIFKQRKVCLYCVTATLINSLMVPPALRELKKS